MKALALTLFALLWAAADVSAYRGIEDPRNAAYLAAPSNASLHSRSRAYREKLAREARHSLEKAAVIDDPGALEPIDGGIAVGCAGSTSAAYDPSGRFLYMTQGAGIEGVCAYRVDPATGALSVLSGSPFPTGAGSGPEALAIDPSGAFLYVANQTANRIAAFAINPETGALTAVPGSPFVAGTFPRSLAIDASGHYLYAVNYGLDVGKGSISAYAIDRATGALAPLPGTPYAAADFPYAIAADPRGKFVYLAGSNLQAYAIDAASGALSPIGAPVAGGRLGVAVDPSGRFVYTTILGGGGSLALGGVDSFAIGGNGTLTKIGSTVPAGSNPVGIGVSRSGSYVYAANLISADISGYAIDLATGALTPIAGSPFAASESVFGIATSGSMPNNDDAQAGTPYSNNIGVAGGTPPYAFAIVGGTLPPGFALDGATGIVRGTTANTGTWNFTVRISDANGEVILSNRTIAVSPHGQTPGSGNYQGLWWNAPAGSEAGWGINFAHQGNIIFATWFTYDANGKPLWFAAVLNNTAQGAYSGDLFTTTGPAFDARPWDSSKVVETIVGAATVTFIGDNDATFNYTVSGVTQQKPITRQIFASPVPACTWGGAPDLALATNYQDLWWNYPAGSEPGWGVNFTQQGDIIFYTWFTYGADDKPLWLIAVAQKQSEGIYAGPISTVTGPAFNAVPWDPANVVETGVGSTIITFTDGNRALFVYTVNGITQSKEITRQVFVPPGTVCQ